MHAHTMLLRTLLILSAALVLVRSWQCPTECICGDETAKTVNATCQVNTTNAFPDLPNNTHVIVILGKPPTGVIRNIDASHLQKFANLTEITLSNLGIQSLASDTFTLHKNLKRIDLGDNELIDLPDGLFDGLTALQYLDLENNKLETITSDQLNFPNLQVLSLKGNNMNLSDSTILDNLKNLHFLELSGNYIGHPLPEYKIPSNTISTVLMKNCSIENLTEHFRKSVEITAERIELSHNLITDIRDIFGQMVFLKELYLENNRIQKIKNYAFEGVKAWALNLNGNHITDIEPQAFHGFTSKKLFLANNRISELPGRIFSNLSADLHLLHLDNNPLIVLNDETFYNLTKLDNLSLHNAQIKHISDGAFINANMKLLDLSDNNLTELSNETLNSIKDVETVHLCGNEWNCTESLLPLHRWLLNRNHSGERACVVCSSPEKFAGTMLVELTEDDLITALDPETTTPEPTTEEPTTQEITTEEPTTEAVTTEELTVQPTDATPIPTDNPNTGRNVIDAGGPDILLYIYIAIAITCLLLFLVLGCMCIKTCYDCREVTYPVAKKEQESGYIDDKDESFREHPEGIFNPNSVKPSESIYTIPSTAGYVNPVFNTEEQDPRLSTGSLSTFQSPGLNREPCRDSGIVGDSPGSNQSINRPLQAWTNGKLGYENRTYSNLDEYI